MHNTDYARKKDFIDKTIESLHKIIPVIFRRKDIPKLFGECISVGNMANLGSNGPPFMRQGRHAIYERETFLLWYRTQLEKKNIQEGLEK